jgi:hypothetical protein
MIYFCQAPPRFKSDWKSDLSSTVRPYFFVYACLDPTGNRIQYQLRHGSIGQGGSGGRLLITVPIEALPLAPGLAEKVTCT